MDFDGKTTNAFEDLLKQLKQEFPEIKETLEKATNGDMSEGEAMASLLSIVQKTSSADRKPPVSCCSSGTPSV